MSSEAAVIRHIRRSERRLFGKYRGTAREFGTGSQLGMIQAYVPSVYGEKVLSPWALPVVPFAGDQHGVLFLPKQDDGVWIEFEGGERDKPIWTGGYWAKSDGKPKGASPDVRVIVSPNGHRVVLDDKDDKLLLEHASGPHIEIAKDSITLEVDGQHRIVIDKQGVHINGTGLEVV